MKKVTKVLVATLVAAPLAAGSVVAAKGYHMYQSGHGWLHGDEATRQEVAEYVQFRITKRLDLNSNQQEKLAAVAEQMGKIRDSMPSDRREQARSIISGERFDRDKARELVDRHVASVQNHSPGMIAVLGDFYDSLDTDQQSEVREMIAERRHMRFGRHFGGRDNRHLGERHRE